MRFCLTMLLCVFCALPMSAADRFEFEDRGFRLRNRDGVTVEESDGFRTSGEDKGIPQATEAAKVNSARQDSRYNGGVNRLGEAGHGVAYRLYPPMYAAPVPVAVPVFVPVPVAVPVVVPMVAPQPCYAPYCSVSRARLMAPHCSVSRARMISGPYYPY